MCMDMYRQSVGYGNVVSEESSSALGVVVDQVRGYGMSSML